MNNTTPTFSCFEDALQRKVFIERDGEKVLAGGREVAEAYSRFKALSESCETVAGEEKGGYVNTASVARDMLEISERLWGLSGVRGRGLQYWGLSYGSVIGSTFAAMFPERVERIVVDGSYLYPVSSAGRGECGLIGMNRNPRYGRLLLYGLESQPPRHR